MDDEPKIAQNPNPNLSPSLQNLVKDKKYLWKKGQSGNPAGRRKGTVDFKRAITESLTKENAKEIIARLYDMAKGEDGYLAVKAIDLIAKVLGAYQNIQATQINVNLLSDEFIQRAKQFINNEPLALKDVETMDGSNNEKPITLCQPPTDTPKSSSTL